MLSACPILLRSSFYVVTQTLLWGGAAQRTAVEQANLALDEKLKEFQSCNVAFETSSFIRRTIF